MSWLLLDAGNTALKWALVPAGLPIWPGAGTAGSAAIYQGVIAGDAPELASELARACALAAAVDGSAGPSLVAGCAVTTPERVAAIHAALQSAGAPPVQWLGAVGSFRHDGIVLDNRYRDPGRLGADRWHALIGARALYPRAALAVINAGTATTVDGVRADGLFSGGVIIPGIDLMRASLAQGTARLPLAGGDYVAHPDNTDDAIRTGILDAQVGLIERRIRRIRELTGTQPQVIVAGGHGAALAPLLRAAGDGSPVDPQPELVLRGLWHGARALAASLIAPTLQDTAPP